MATRRFLATVLALCLIPAPGRAQEASPDEPRLDVSRKALGKLVEAAAYADGAAAWQAQQPATMSKAERKVVGAILIAAGTGLMVAAFRYKTAAQRECEAGSLACFHDDVDFEELVPTLLISVGSVAILSGVVLVVR
jgi:hypothetical protein